MQLLDRLFSELDVAVEPFSVCELRGHGRLDLPPQDLAVLHYVLAGRGRLEVPGWGGVDLQPHSVVVVPSGAPHRLLAFESPEDGYTLPVCGPLSGGWQNDRVGAGNSGMMAACGAVSATYRQIHGLFDFLPEPIVERVRAGDELNRAFIALLDELSRPEAGTRTLARLLMSQCLVLILRRFCADGACRLAWLNALEDPRLGRAIDAILTDPAAAHSVQSLADTTGMSRSAFAEHFQAVFERSPMDLLREIRLRRAARLLLDRDTPVKSLARDVGFDSRSYFSRAFKEFFGASPSEFRQNARTDG